MKKKELAEAIEVVSNCEKSIDRLSTKISASLMKYETLSDNYNEMVKAYKNHNEIIHTLITQNFIDNPTYKAVVLIPYRGKPTFIKDGKVVAEDASEVTMTWDAYERSVRFSTENM
ncbi:hypothetical protein [Eubacterium ramulus]|uniref:hypothetical protein n=1 Tax=Eubacterium ramulus TaxID=39490 RepID=UPI00399C2010